MKKSLKFLGIIVLAAVIGFSMAACKTTGGVTETAAKPGLTITGLDKYNGSYIQAEIEGGFLAGSHFLEDYDPMLGNLAGVLIQNGTATLNVWIVGADEEVEYDEEEGGNTRIYTSYTGSDELEFFVTIWSGAEVYDSNNTAAAGNVNVKFNNGSAEGAINITYEPEVETAEEL